MSSTPHQAWHAQATALEERDRAADELQEEVNGLDDDDAAARLREIAVGLHANFPQYDGHWKRHESATAVKNWYKGGRYYMRRGDRVLCRRRPDGQ